VHLLFFLHILVLLARKLKRSLTLGLTITFISNFVRIGQQLWKLKYGTRSPINTHSLA